MVRFVFMRKKNKLTLYFEYYNLVKTNEPKSKRKVYNLIFVLNHLGLLEEIILKTV